MEYVTKCNTCSLVRHTDCKNEAFLKCSYCKGKKNKGIMELVEAIGWGRSPDVKVTKEKIKRVKPHRVLPQKKIKRVRVKI